MYIAFKWLVALSFVMWLVMCFVDHFIKETMRLKEIDVLEKQIGTLLKNVSIKNEYRRTTSRKEQLYERDHNMPYLYFSMFIAGALTVSAFHKKNDIIIYAKNRLLVVEMSSFMKNKKLRRFKKTATMIGVAILKYLQYLRENIITFSYRIVRILKINPNDQSRIHLIMLNKLKETGEERKNLGQLLIAAVHENKNIRMRYQLETLTKNRLEQHIETIQKEIKEIRLKYVSFQHLYLTTHQENIYLNSRIRKLKKDKDEAEKNLMALINEVYRSSNSQLKAYCTRFIVKTKDNLLNSDVNAEIKEFLEKNGEPNNFSCAQSWTNCTRISEVLNEDDSLVPVISDVQNIPEEYKCFVGTVKDKNGIIQKLYEYDYKSSINSRDTIQRIRQYSVYYDKDCLLDFSKLQQEPKAEFIASSATKKKVEHLYNPRLVTGSEAFQTFLLNNKRVVLKNSSSNMLCQ